MSTTLPISPRDLQVHRPPPKRDVPYVPTDEPVVAAMLRFANVTERDVVFDLGCGDGRIVIAAAKHCGCHGVGVDIDPQRITESREAAHKAGVSARVRFLCQSFFDTDLRAASVVFLYLLPSINVKLRPKLLAELRTGSRIIANQFDMGRWGPDIEGSAHGRALHQWIVPAFVEGTWRCVVNVPDDRWKMVLALSRRYQNVTGTARIGRQRLELANGRLFGDYLTFKLPDPQRAGTMMRFAARMDRQYLRGGFYPDPLSFTPIVWGGVRR